LDLLEGGENCADALRRPPYRGLSDPDALSFLGLLLVDKLGYAACSANPPAFAGDLPALAGEFARWRAVDLVAVFHDPRFLGIVNPKQAGQLAALGRPLPRELLVVYAGSARGDLPRDLSLGAARTALALLGGAHPAIPPELRSAAPRSAPRRAPRSPAPGPLRTTPLYAVPVTNEVLHYGNVEAWKRVIGEYENAHPRCAVRVYYDGEPVRDLNALFAWGKMPRGRVLQFSVSSSAAIRDTARLRRRLAQASSRDFEPLLGGGPADMTGGGSPG
jgi:hypothetical protein